MSQKKRVELHYLEEARRACRMFPSGHPVPHEPLDFLFDRENGTLGIELTELCREDERREAARLGYVAPKAKRLYSARPGSKPVNVSPVFSPDADEMPVDELAQGLAEFVYSHQDANANLEWYENRDMPKGYTQIGVFPPFDFEPEGDWRYFRAFSVHRAPRQLIEARITYQQPTT